VDAVAAALALHWDLVATRLDYLPEGGGAYHWLAATGDGGRWFVTVDDLDTKPWLGADRTGVFAGLAAAYRVAADLHDGGLSFVVAPRPSTAGDATIRLHPRYSMAVLPFVEGRPGRWGDAIDHNGMSEVVDLLVMLHRSTRSARRARVRPRRIPGRATLEVALRELDRPWEGGPFAEPARHELARHFEVIAGALAASDRMARGLADAPAPPVVTHGEMHPGNLILTDEGLALVDWDTVALDRPERDLWFLDDPTGAARAAYEALTGDPIDPLALRYYGLAWALTDLAAFTARLRSPHTRNADTERTWSAVQLLLAGREPAPYGERVVWTTWT
jgi:spectinomycin phosphotransferase